MNITRIAQCLFADVWGGIAAAAVVLPQAMAFGVVLFQTMGLGAATGALAGLIGAAAVSMGSGAIGGTRGLISSPTGPTLVLASSAIAALIAAGSGQTSLVLSLSIILLLTGAFQILIGLSGGGKLVKFIPYTVVAGFMTGSALLMIRSQMTPLFGDDPMALTMQESLPIFIALITILTMQYLPRLLPWIPGTVLGLVIGTAAFHALVLLSSGYPDTWVIGTLPSITKFEFNLSWSDLQQLPWLVIFLAAFALAVLASLDTLLTSVIADVGTSARHNARKELLGQGIGQIVAGLFAGLPGAGTTGATLVAVKTGGRRWPGVSASLTFVALIFFGSEIGQYLPTSVLAGIIIHVALQMIDLDILAWIRRRKTRIDAGIALLVTGVTVTYDLMIAVAVGIVIAVILQLRAQINTPVVHRRTTALFRQSSQARTNEQRQLLEQSGERIIIYQLKGNFFFATADILFEQILPDLNAANWIILDLRRVPQVDLTGVKILQQIANRLNHNNGVLIFSEVHHEAGLGKNVKNTLKKISPHNKKIKVKTFNSTDEALEFAENNLLKSCGVQHISKQESMLLKDVDICENMSNDELNVFEKMLQKVIVSKGSYLFHRGDMGTALYIVRKGTIDIRISTSAHHYQRIAKYGTGMMFGEIAFLSPGPRTGDATALEDSELWMLERSDFDQLDQSYEKTAIAFLLALGVQQQDMIRHSANEVKRLSAW